VRLTGLTSLSDAPILNSEYMASPQIKNTKGLAPEWANLPRRRCDNCGHTYKPARPVVEGQHGFCKPNCRKEFHKHQGAYRQLKELLKKTVEKELKTISENRIREIIREEMALSLQLTPAAYRENFAAAVSKFTSPCP